MQAIVEALRTGRFMFDGRSYVVVCPRTRQAAIIDPDMNLLRLQDAVAKHNAQVRWVLLTHGHFDHIASADEVRDQTGAALAIHSLDAPMLGDPQRNLAAVYHLKTAIRPADRLLAEGDTIDIGALTLRVLHTPGHSTGSCTYALGGCAFTGDLLMRGAYGRVDFPGGDITALRASAERVLALPEDTVLYPGHGPSTTVGEERRTNPILWEYE